ncbi:MAG TPA: DsbA family protein [Pseudolabrys sp.]|nr:DsbA family protein [Pseudolabrys sp.]
MTELAPLERRKRFTGLIAWLLVLLTLLAVLGAWFAFHPGFRWGQTGAHWAVAMPKDEFEQRIQTYLLNHPEVLIESLNRMEQRQRASAETEVQAIIQSRADELFRDVDSPVGGNPNGNITLVEFFDYNCPYCRQMVPVMTQAESADSQLRVVYKEFPILGPNSKFAAKAAFAAHKQGKYLAFHKALFQVRGAVDPSKVTEVAATVGLDVDRLKADMDDPAIAALIEKNLALAQALRIDGTPGFVAGRQVLRGAIDLKALQGFIQEARGSP